MTASARYVLGRLAIVETRVRHLVAQRRAVDAEPDDPVRGLYISEDDVDRLLDPAVPVVPLDVTGWLADVEVSADAAERVGQDLRLRRLTSTFGLEDVDVEILLTAMAPDLDPRFERLYGYLHDDITRRRASIGLALELMGIPLSNVEARARLQPEAPLVTSGLVVIDDTERPVLTRSLRVPDRVTAHLLGDDAPVPRVAAATITVPVMEVAGADEVRAAVDAGERLVHVRETARTAGFGVAVAGLSATGRETLAIDLGSVHGDAAGLVTDAVLEAGLRNAALVIGPLDAVIEQHHGVLAPLRRALVPTVVVSAAAWEPRWLAEMPVAVVAGAVEASQLWQGVVPANPGFDAAAEMVAFRLRPEQALRSWRMAERVARVAGGRVAASDLRAGARLQNAGRLDSLARRIEPVADMNDLVLPPRVLATLEEIIRWAHHRDQVLDDWHMGGRSARGRGITALFAGPSGTGKTLSAEVIAGALALDLYVIDLSAVVDKYIGETEKNLERVLDRAEGINAVLFFDEADALFGKRSEVSDARDRYANLEISYLLQRMERFDGVTILATNLRANLDEAFTRRIDVLVDFPDPTEHDRKRLWELHLPPELPRDGDLDLDYLAKAFELAGGDIRNITLAAAYTAAAEERAVATADLVQATAREYRKLGRLVTASEFGLYHDLVTT
jgi:predicted nucleic acid-binding protein